jgi:hypothetical protein
MIQVTKVAERLWCVVVDVEGITGETMVACETQEEAEAYARNVFLSDLRRNDWRFAHVRFPWEPEEVESDGDDTDQEV